MDSRNGGLEKGDSVKIWYFFSVSMLKFQGALVFCLGCKPQNLPRGNGQRFAPTSDPKQVVSRWPGGFALYQSQGAGFVGWKNAWNFGIPRDSGPPTVLINGDYLSPYKWPKINGFHMVSLSFLLYCKWNCGPLYLLMGPLLITGDGAHFVGCVHIFKILEKNLDIWGCIGVKSSA